MQPLPKFSRTCLFLLSASHLLAVTYPDKPSLVQCCVGNSVSVGRGWWVNRESWALFLLRSSYQILAAFSHRYIFQKKTKGAFELWVYRDSGCRIPQCLPVAQVLKVPPGWWSVTDERIWVSWRCCCGGMHTLVISMWHWAHTGALGVRDELEVLPMINISRSSCSGKVTAGKVWPDKNLNIMACDLKKKNHY